MCYPTLLIGLRSPLTYVRGLERGMVSVAVPATAKQVKVAAAKEKKLEFLVLMF